VEGDFFQTNLWAISKARLGSVPGRRPTSALRDKYLLVIVVGTPGYSLHLKMEKGDK